MALLNDIRRLREIANTAVRTKESDATQAQLQQYVGTMMIQNAEEFVTAWLIHSNEYVPLTRGVAALLARASSQVELPK